MIKKFKKRHKQIRAKPSLQTNKTKSKQTKPGAKPSCKPKKQNQCKCTENLCLQRCEKKPPYKVKWTYKHPDKIDVLQWVTCFDLFASIVVPTAAKACLIVPGTTRHIPAQPCLWFHWNRLWCVISIVHSSI